MYICIPLTDLRLWHVGARAAAANSLPLFLFDMTGGGRRVRMRTDGRTATVAKLRHHALPVGTETNLSISGLLASCNWGMTINGGFALLRIPL